MNAWILKKSHLPYWLRQFRKKMELIAPMRERGDIVFRTIEKIHEIALDCPASLPSPKEFLTPQYEPMLETAKKPKALNSTSSRVIFGVRSCDMAALKLLDGFYLEGFRDPYYESRRKKTLFISVVCNKPDNTCFCAGLGAGPYLKGGFDIQLYDLGDRYFVEAGSKEAERRIRAYSFLMRRPGKADLEDQFEVQLSSQAMFQKRISLRRAQNAMTKLGDDFWGRVSERCIECGGCVYECPLCTCFTVIDRKYEGVTERARVWDACLFKGFTRLAGGHLPNEDRLLRIKRWFYHKLLYYPEKFGGFGCVGCGRCAVTCPAKIDMASVVLMMKNGKEE